MTERVVTKGRYLCAAARKLVRAGFAYSVVRLGPEMNRNWNCDSLGTTPVSWNASADRFAAIVVAMRSVPGGHFLFDWNRNADYRPVPLGAYCPGNKCVDIIGVDAYDSSGVKGLPSAGSGLRWQQLSPNHRGSTPRRASRSGTASRSASRSGEPWPPRPAAPATTQATCSTWVSSSPTMMSGSTHGSTRVTTV
ncbi:MAG: hypothetical protein M0Z46_19685 [Actinomycetota bacterium]|nr:hypothetical protein [Actinomycetota bacterium]